MTWPRISAGEVFAAAPDRPFARSLRRKRRRERNERARSSDRDRSHIFTPFSLKYFTAPGCQGIGEFFSS
jgi:hypothetical protein